MEEEALAQLGKKIEETGLDPEDIAIISESRLEELRDEHQSLAEDAKTPYAEALADATGMSKEMLMDGHDYDALKEEYDRRLDELEEEEEGRPEELEQSLDPSPKAQNTETEELEEEEESAVEELEASEREDLSDLADQIETYENAGGPWQGAADGAREEFEELAGEKYEDFDVAEL